MTAFYGHLPFSASYPTMGSNEGMRIQDMYGQNLPMMLPAEGLGAALQTSSYSPEAGVSPYARGGEVERKFPLRGLAAFLQDQGRHGDTLLAHINPEEAEMLEALGGSGTINPETGLPEFWWGKFRKRFIDPVTKPVAQIFKKIAGPVGLAVVGNMIAPGIGGVIGGGLGGMFGHPNIRMGPLAGAGVGQLGLAGLNALGSGASSLGYGGLGSSLQGMGGANYLSSLMNSVSPGIAAYMGPQAQLPGFMQGLGSFFGGSGTGSSVAASPPFSMNPVSQLASTLASKGTASGAGGGLGSFLGGNMLNNALLATAIGGTLLRREKPQGPQSLGEAMMQAEKHRWRPDQYPDKNAFKPVTRKYKGYSAHYRPGFDGEEEAFMEDSPWQYTPRFSEQKFSEQKFSEGGFLDGESLGQEDNVPALLSEGEYVIPADVVADLGDGNSKAGAKRLHQMIAQVRHHKNTGKHPPQSKGLGVYFNV